MNPTRRSFFASMASWMASLPVLSAWMARPVDASSAVSAPRNYWRESASFWASCAISHGEIINRIAKVAKFELDCSDGLGCGPADAMAQMIEQGGFIRWIPVTERLPDKPQRYLVYADFGNSHSHISLLYFSYWGDGSGPSFGAGQVVTHWAEMPSPPTEPASCKSS